MRKMIPYGRALLASCFLLTTTAAMAVLPGFVAVSKDYKACDVTSDYNLPIVTKEYEKFLQTIDQDKSHASVPELQSILASLHEASKTYWLDSHSYVMRDKDRGFMRIHELWQKYSQLSWWIEGARLVENKEALIHQFYRHHWRLERAMKLFFIYDKSLGGKNKLGLMALNAWFGLHIPGFDLIHPLVEWFRLRA
jgi:hypothetical protein